MLDAKRGSLLAAVGLWAWLGTPTDGLAATPAAPAEDAKADSDAGEGRAHALTVAGRAGNPGYGLLLGYRARLRRGIGIGLEVEGSFAPDAFIGGYETHDNATLAGRVPLFFPVHRTRRLTMALTLTPGVRTVRSFDAGFAETTGLSTTIDIGIRAYLRLHPRLTWLAGVDTPVSIQVVPIVDVDTIGSLLVTGPVVPIGDRLSWYATVEAGGIFGSNGDAGKFLIRGTTGLRIIFGTSAHRWRAF